MKAVVFDVDHTLLDFDLDEKAAYEKTCRFYGVDVTKEEIEEFWKLSYESWLVYELHLVHTEKIQREYHQRYTDNLVWLFAHSKIQLPEGREETFNRFFAERGHEIEDAYEIVSEAAKKYDVYLATNGFTEIQLGRCQRFLPLVKEAFISESVGTIKPARVFFDEMLSKIPYPPEEILMVGDSYPSDIVGAREVGMKTCFFERHGEGKTADYVIHSLKELKEIL